MENKSLFFVSKKYKYTSSVLKIMMSPTEDKIDQAIKAETAADGKGDEESNMDVKPNASVVSETMKSKKEQDTYPLAEDVYALIFAAPVCSAGFMFALYIVVTKLICYCILLSDINLNGFSGFSRKSAAVKFFLLPVAVAMQEDLMEAFSAVANIAYDPKVMEIEKSATRSKFHLYTWLRAIDGILSLAVNFCVMLTTGEVLGVFLNFAALGFLQSIDDIFYELVSMGFFGDRMEHWTIRCKLMEFPRRHGDTNKSLCGTKLRTTHLDSVLFALTFTICLAAYAVMMAYQEGQW